ncbi:hypothetical protein F441_04738 [Phytophthora nicotianae CJ01A1]|uniref:Uncharacterized protein n=2 Tax=Phytophthora nicotianae TaxID=4792 RepID=V9F2V3_PHYNI|nr:hypothetical protein F443_09997 [Phytophthora nicotianae P1569]ETP21828.1 hypothetical protein F441_04738 [Phytophthora nicotianae CJ01A1]
MHYKLLTIWNEDSAFAVGGSANLTKAAWTRNDELIFHVEGHGAYQAQERFDTLLQKCVRTTPENLSPTRLSSRGSPYSSERSHESQDTVFLTAERSSSPSIAQPSPSYGRTEDTPPLEQPTWWNDPHITGRY